MIKQKDNKLWLTLKKGCTHDINTKKRKEKMNSVHKTWESLYIYQRLCDTTKAVYCTVYCTVHCRLWRKKWFVLRFDNGLTVGLSFWFLLSYFNVLTYTKKNVSKYYTKRQLFNSPKKGFLVVVWCNILITKYCTYFFIYVQKGVSSWPLKNSACNIQNYVKYLLEL